MKENLDGREVRRLRKGITTGSCAAAAAAAAARCLLLGEKPASVWIRLPGGVRREIPVRQAGEAGSGRCLFAVKKYSGDDPDVTDGMEILAEAAVMTCQAPAGAFRDDVFPGLFLDGGRGVGRVTKAGLSQEIGQAAINPVPRRMIFDAVGEVREEAGREDDLLITVTVPGGEETALRTFNPHLGIIGGISILGTTGIVEPMSEKAIVDTIELLIRQRAALGEMRLLLVPGHYGKRYAGEELGLDAEKAVEISNYIGEGLDLAAEYGFREVLLVGNAGKLCKLAAGIMNTHSRTADGRGEIFGVHAAMAGASPGQVRTLMSCVTTDRMLEYLRSWEMDGQVISSVLAAVKQHMDRRVRGRFSYGAAMFSEQYGLLGMTEGTGEILAHFR